MFKKSVSIFLSFVFIISLIPVFSIPAFAEDKTESVAVTFEEIISAAATIVRQNEGSYASVNRDDNGALSIGWIQWHANRALNLLKTIVSANDQNAQTILGEALYNEIKTATSWTTRILTEDEGKKVSQLISTDEGKKAQDDLAAKDLSSYINRAVGYGITDPASLVYYADIENQCGSGGAKRVAAQSLLTLFTKLPLLIPSQESTHPAVRRPTTTVSFSTGNPPLSTARYGLRP